MSDITEQLKAMFRRLRDLHGMTGQSLAWRDTFYKAADEIERLTAALAAAERERDALAAAMPSEGADAALAYAAEKTKREELERERDRLREALDNLQMQGTRSPDLPAWILVPSVEWESVYAAIAQQEGEK